MYGEMKRAERLWAYILTLPDQDLLEAENTWTLMKCGGQGEHKYVWSDGMDVMSAAGGKTFHNSQEVRPKIKKKPSNAPWRRFRIGIWDYRNAL